MSVALRSRPSAMAALALLLVAPALFAARVTKLPDDAFAALRQQVPARTIRIDKLPIYDGSRSVIDLQEFRVWAPDGKIVIHGDNGKVLKTLAPPPMRFFRRTGQRRSQIIRLLLHGSLGQKR